MIFNPIIHLILAVIAGVIGFIVLNDAASWLVLLPCLFFILTFFVALALPEMTQSFTRYRAVSKHHAQMNRSTRQALMRDRTETKPSTSPFTNLERLTSRSLRSHSRPPHGLSEVEHPDSTASRSQSAAPMAAHP